MLCSATYVNRIPELICREDQLELSDALFVFVNVNAKEALSVDL